MFSVAGIRNLKLSFLAFLIVLRCSAVIFTIYFLTVSLYPCWALKVILTFRLEESNLVFLMTY